MNSKTRINHVIQSLIDPVVTYELFELILFYASMTRKIMGESAPIVHQIIQLSESMISHFYSLLTLQSTSLSKELSFIDNSFEALDQTQRIMGQIVRFNSIHTILPLIYMYIINLHYLLFVLLSFQIYQSIPPSIL